MTSIDRAFLRGFNTEALAALQSLAEKHGVTITKKSGSFARDGSNATIKFELATKNADGTVSTAASQAFKAQAARYGLDPDALGTTFTHQRTEYRITGLSTRRPKFPISAERVFDGKPFKFPADVVARKTGTSTSEGLTQEIKREFSSLASRLSPENLHCDGEISRAEAGRRRTQILREWRALEARAGRKVDEYEAFDL